MLSWLTPAVLGALAAGCCGAVGVALAEEILGLRLRLSAASDARAAEVAESMALVT